MLSPRYWTFLLIVFIAVAYSMYKQNSQIELITSPADPYSYRYVQLDNGLKALLIHAPDSDKAAAAMTVPVGSGDDPQGREGLAHFLEHMLFLGTEPFPEAGEYQAYISRHGGGHNAFTAHAQTTYFYEIDNDAMAGALERFAPFFISPTFDEAYVEREKNAVNAEYFSKIKDDFRRIYSAEKQALNPKHPLASFSTGNLDTLADRPDSKVRDELLEFYKKHYSADRMTLVLAGNYSLDQLESWAVSHFAAVPKRDSQPEINTEPLFAEGQLPLDMNIQPVKELRRLQFSLPMPATKDNYAYKPLRVISNLIGHEGEGSLLALLKQKGWAEALSAGQSLNTDNQASLSIQVHLTREGLAYTDQITQALLHYFELLKQQPLPEYLVTEQAKLNDLSFRFLEHGSLKDFAVRLSTNLLMFPAEDVLYGDYRLSYNAEILKPYLQALNGNNMLRTLIAPEVSTDMKDPWYDTPMRLRPGKYQPVERFSAELSALHLPEANPFVPDSFELAQTPAQQQPQAIINNAQRSVWYYPEHDFKQPKVHVRVLLENPTVKTSAKDKILARLYTRSVNEALNTYSYPAYLAGLSYNLSSASKGILLHIGGYEDKANELLERILLQMNENQLAEDDFIRYRNSLQRNLENQLKGKPYERSLARLKNWLFEPSFSPEELLAALEQVNRDDVADFAQRFKAKVAHTIYIHGSLDQDQALALAEKVQQHLPANGQRLGSLELVRVPAGQYQHNLELEHPDTAFTLYIQGDDTSDHSRAQYGLLGQMLSAPYYQYMRTEQQLGYIVHATAYPQQGVPALAFIVESPSASPQQMLEHSNIFFNDFADKMANFSEEEFAAFQRGLVNLLTEKPKNMAEKASRFWRDLSQQRLSFDTNEAIAGEVEKLTLKQLQDLYQQAISQRQQPWVVITQRGQLDKQEGFSQLSDIAREQQPRFSLPAPKLVSENDSQ